MLLAKQCICGSTEFEKEPDDNVLRCAECCRLARLVLVNEFEEKRKIKNVRNRQNT